MVRVLGAVGAAVIVALVVLLGPGAAPSGADTASGFRFEESEFQSAEGQPIVRVVVRRTSLPVGRALIDYRTEAGSAAEGTDFQGTRGTLVFDVGASTASFSVLLRDDDVAEDAVERFSVLLVDRETSERATVTIVDDDRRAAASSSAPVATVAPAVPTTVAAPVGSGGATAVAAAAPPTARGRARASAPAAASSGRRRVTVRQSPVTPFELRPVGPPGGAQGGAGTTVDPLVAVAAGLLLARVAAEVWFRARTAVA